MSVTSQIKNMDTRLHDELRRRLYEIAAESFRNSMLALIAEAEAEGVALDGRYCRSGNVVSTYMIVEDE